MTYRYVHESEDIEEVLAAADDANTVDFEIILLKRAIELLKRKLEAA